ncbi:MAG: hypothetical protein EHM42_01640 [Planctomycetaceae bacterium]|nr:MAG: hypothetical protein EHM42_01640 [Planctomycetaceae bacterium]
MTYYGRLSDIVSLGIDDLLANASDRPNAIAQIIAEIEEGLGGARRSVAGAAKSLEKLRTELAERRTQAEQWARLAKQELEAGKEDAARQALFRKRETSDLAAGIEQHVAAALSTQEHLSTTLRAIEEHMAKTRRRQVELAQIAGEAAARPKKKGDSTYGRPAVAGAVDPKRTQAVEDELSALKRELGQG